jgi:hypothetical protein
MTYGLQMSVVNGGAGRREKSPESAFFFREGSGR